MSSEPRRSGGSRPVVGSLVRPGDGGVVVKDGADVLKGPVNGKEGSEAVNEFEPWRGIGAGDVSWEMRNVVSGQNNTNIRPVDPHVHKGEMRFH